MTGENPAELRPCGCGGEAKAERRKSAYERYSAKCSNCRLETPRFNTLEKAIEHWNRALSAPAGEPRMTDAGPIKAEGGR